jgi:gluconokinase
VIVVVSGVSGVGKTTVGQRVARELGVRFVVGDDYHPAASVAMMARGEGLDDDDRAPWLAAIRASIEGWLARDEDVVLACSALKDSYREALAKGDRRVRFVVLDAPREVVEARLAARTGHFAKPALLDSQLAIREPPRDALIVDATRPLNDQIAEITSWARGS